ncbi:hypothetical protein [Microbispora sp. NBRC 16548]|uniref:hypothetical protein n=1 Tax=Microbispora sp. NBRC 16548 TaxID=3030994 RepID=UPI0024A55E29|nr:hypothetical protein [Microbispora sp. NBRC 16548]GLX03212.1 hypothetical protein Misp03_01390 [Microbispora sp. NBRC 16548]
MPGIDHEMPLKLIRNRPETALELLRCVTGDDIPPHAAARVETVDCTQAPIEFRADSVVIARDAAGAALMAVIVEVQLRRDSGKRFSWPVYVTTLRSRHKCDTALLVICPDRSTARWCERTIHLGPSGAITPLAIDPGRIPLITDPDQARASPELAVLSTVAHPEEAEDGPALEAMLAGLKTLDQEQRTLYLNYVFRSLPAVTIKRLEEMVTTIRDFEDLGKKYFSHWVAEGQIKAIFNVLDARGLEISDDARERIRRCENPDQLIDWVRKAAVVTSADDLFD